MIEQELLAATGQKEKGKRETPQDYLVRIALAVSELPEEPVDKYEELSEPSKVWYLQAAEALGAEPPEPENIKPFSDFDKAEGEGEPPEDPPEPEKKKKSAPTKDSKKKPPKVKEEKKEVVVKKEPKNKGPAPLRETSVADTIRFVMCEDPSLTKDDVAKALKEKKLTFDQSRLDQIYSGTARVLQILQQMKKLK
jgi:hypothetical protein